MSLLSVAIAHRLGDLSLDVAFEAPEGVTVLFGASGAGKTSVVNAIAGLLRPRRAHIALGGEVLQDSETGRFVPVHKRRLGYVFQDGRLFPHMTVARNLTYGRARATTPAPGLEEVAALLGLEQLMERMPGALSGGEKQRVAIGRALLSRPRMLLMDEPLAALDAPRKAEILPYLERLRDQAGLPILYVSHAVGEVARLARTVVVLRDGRVVQSGPAEAVFSDPELVRHVGLREAGAILTARVRAHHPDGLTELAISGGTLLLPHQHAAPGDALRVRILAQDVILSRVAPRGLSALNILPVRVIALRSGAGPGVMVQLACGQDRLLARITGRSAAALSLRPGQTAFAIVKSVSVAPGDIGAL